MINFSDVIGTFSGNGFDDVEVIEISSKLALLSDQDEIWLEGISCFLIKNGEFEEFDPQNEFQDKIAGDLKVLTPLERQCYFLYEFRKRKPISICKELNITTNVCWKAICRARKKIEDFRKAA